MRDCISISWIKHKEEKEGEGVERRGRMRGGGYEPFTGTSREEVTE